MTFEEFNNTIIKVEGITNFKKSMNKECKKLVIDFVDKKFKSYDFNLLGSIYGIKIFVDKKIPKNEAHLCNGKEKIIIKLNY